MKGHVATPSDLADLMVEKLFEEREPESDDRILYPGVGSNAPFIQSVQQWCEEHDRPTPEGIGVELDPERISDAREYIELSNTTLIEGDFLSTDLPEEIGEFDYIIGNPPYVSVTQLSDDEKEKYSAEFDTAWRRFDLYILFFERGLELLVENGRLCYVTPEKYEYISSANTLRKLLTKYHIREIEHISQDWFSGYKTYPAITTIDAVDPDETQVIQRDGQNNIVDLPTDGSSWASTIRGGSDLDTGVTLGDITVRISAGLATGRDSLYVISKGDIPQLEKEGWAYATVSGKQLRTFDGPYTNDLILCPYDERGNLIPEDKLGSFGEWAEIYRDELEERSCVQKRGRAWYGWHNAPPMEEILQPKIVCKDVTKEPEFWAEPEGSVLPRHSVYYIIPKNNDDIDDLLAYLNSNEAKEWIEANAQKAYTDHIRIQSEVIEDLPVPTQFAETAQSKLI